MSFTSRDGLSLVQKVAPNSKYRPIELSDESVFNMAQYNYTADEIAERFNISRTTLMKHHGDAFNAGKFEAKNLPRHALTRIIKEFMDLDEGMLTRSDVPSNVLLKAIDLHARKYEQLGQKQIVEHIGLQYDAVESKPQIIERPDVEAE
jgi:hypothetical protein